MRTRSDILRRPFGPSATWPLGRLAPWPLLLLLIGACVEQPIVRELPDFRARDRDAPGGSLKLNPSLVEPMYTTLLPIDLPTVVKVAAADNIAIRLARYQVEQTHGQLESRVGAALPAVVPRALFQRIDGRNLNSNGDLFNVGFGVFQPSVAVEWILNPGQAIYEIIAAKKRVTASQYREAAVIQQSLRIAIEQYYELVLAQALIAAAHQAAEEAKELVRIEQLRKQAGVGVLADELRAQARLAEREQDFAVAMNALYHASLALTLTLQLEDPTITLIPDADSVPPLRLVRDDLEIEEMLAVAVKFRPDLEALRILAEAAADDALGTWWQGLGPEFALSYHYGGITAHSNNIRPAQGIPNNLILNPLSTTGSFSGNAFLNGLSREAIGRGSRQLEGSRDVTFRFNQRTEFNAGAAARWSLSAFGDLRTARAAKQQAMLEARRKLLEVRAEVVDAVQTNNLSDKLIEMAGRQVTAANEALRLTEANLEAGTMTTLDVLQAQDAVAQARLRFAEAVVRYNQSQVNLLAALGILDECNTFN